MLFTSIIGGYFGGESHSPATVSLAAPQGQKGERSLAHPLYYYILVQVSTLYYITKYNTLHCTIYNTTL